MSNGYSWYNKGDAAIAEALFQSLRRHWPNCQITFISLTPNVDTEKYQNYGIEVVGKSLARINDVRRSKILRGLEIGAKWMTAAKGTDYSKSISKSDAVIACGGGYLHDSFGKSAKIHLHQMKTATRHGVPLVLANQSIGPFIDHKRASSAARTLNAASSIVVRERISQEYLKNMGVDESLVTLGPDLAFALNPDNAALPPLLDKLPRPILGVTARFWPFPGHSDPTAKMQNYLLSLKSSINSFYGRFGGSIVFLPQVIVPTGDDDRIISKKVMDSLTPDAQKASILLSDDLSPSVLRRVMGTIDILLATRLHSAIFALSEGTPAVVIGYEHKAQGILGDLDLSDLLIQIDQVDSSRVTDLVLRTYENSVATQARIQRAIAPLGHQADAALFQAISRSLDNENTIN